MSTQIAKSRSQIVFARPTVMPKHNTLVNHWMGSHKINCDESRRTQQAATPSTRAVKIEPSSCSATNHRAQNVIFVLHRLLCSLTQSHDDESHNKLHQVAVAIRDTVVHGQGQNRRGRHVEQYAQLVLSAIEESLAVQLLSPKRYGHALINLMNRVEVSLGILLLCLARLGTKLLWVIGIASLPAPPSQKYQIGEHPDWRRRSGES
jgi:hypothetical protein